MYFSVSNRLRKRFYEFSISSARGKWIEKKGIKYMPTFHPAALLRDESKKIDFWNDLKLVKEMNEKIKE